MEKKNFYSKELAEDFTSISKSYVKKRKEKERIPLSEHHLTFSNDREPDRLHLNSENASCWNTHHKLFKPKNETETYSFTGSESEVATLTDSQLNQLEQRPFDDDPTVANPQPREDELTKSNSNHCKLIEGWKLESHASVKRTSSLPEMRNAEQSLTNFNLEEKTDETNEDHSTVRPDNTSDQITSENTDAADVSEDRNSSESNKDKDETMQRIKKQGAYSLENFPDVDQLQSGISNLKPITKDDNDVGDQDSTIDKRKQNILKTKLNFLEQILEARSRLKPPRNNENSKNKGTEGNLSLQGCDSKELLTSNLEDALIGRGSYASVIQCRHRTLEEVAVKCLNISSTESLKNGKQEAMVLQQLSHKNIVQFYEFTEWIKKNGKVVFGIVMEVANGGNLEDFLDFTKTKLIDIPWSLRLRFFVEIANALDYLHYHDAKRSYIHGDLKPQNILLNQNLAVKLSDFGSSEIIANFETLTTNHVPSKQYTILYTAPEYLRDILDNTGWEKTHEEKTLIATQRKSLAMDVYSFGMVGYEIITSFQVYSNSNPGSYVILKLIAELGQKPDETKFDEVLETITDEKDKQICKDLIKLVEDCWSFEPSERPDIKQVNKDLEKILEESGYQLTKDYSKIARQFVKKRNLQYAVPLSDCFLLQPNWHQGKRAPWEKRYKTEYLSRTLDGIQYLQSGLSKRRPRFSPVSENSSSLSPSIDSGYFSCSSKIRNMMPTVEKGTSASVTMIDKETQCTGLSFTDDDDVFTCDFKQLHDLDEDIKADLKTEMRSLVENKVKSIARQKAKEKFNQTAKQALTDLKTFLIQDASDKKESFQPTYLDQTISDIQVELSDRWSSSAFNNGTSFPEGNVSLQELLDKYEPTRHSFIAIVGSSGSGKTAIVKNLLEEYSKSEVLKGAEFVFQIDFFDVNLKKKTNLLKVLAHSLPHHWVVNNVASEVVLKDLDENQNLWVIIDGFKPKDTSCDESSAIQLPEPTLTTENHILNILLRKSLAGGRILVTLRPSQLLELPPALNPYPVACILGINKENQKRLSQQISSSFSEKIISYLQENSTLNSFCFILENCVSVMYTIDGLLSEEKTLHPLTTFPITQIIVSALDLLLWDKELKNSNCDFSCVANFAWQSFSNPDLEYTEIQKLTKHSCEVVDVFSYLSCPKSFSSRFNVSLYQICQDLGVAMHLLWINNEDQLLNFLRRWLKVHVLDRTSQFRDVTKFLFGLCNNSTQEFLRQLLPSLDDFKVRSDVLVEHVMNTFKCLDSQEQKRFSTLLSLTSLAFEMQQADFTNELANSIFPDEIHVDIDCSSSEVAAFFYILKSRNKKLIVRNTEILTGLSKTIFLEAKANLSLDICFE